MRSRARKAAGVAVLTALVLEAVFRAWTLAHGEHGPAPDRSTEEEWDWAARHLEAGSPVLESTLAYDARLGWRNAPGLRLDGLTTNADGWRADHEFAPAKPGGVRRLVLVGDSYTFGHAARDEHVFAAQVQARLGPGWEVLNFAVPGYGTDQQVLAYEEVARAYAPDAVVLGFFLRDYSRNLMRFRSYAKPRFELDGDGLVVRGQPVPPPEELYAEYADGGRRAGASPWSSWLLAKVRAEWREHNERAIDADAEGWQLVARMQERFRAAVLADGAVPLWLVIPTEDLVIAEDADYGRLAALAGEHAARIGLDCVDLTPLLAQHERAHPEDPFHNPAEVGGHLSPTGHRIAADALLAWLAGRFPGDVPGGPAEDG